MQIGKMVRVQRPALLGDRQSFACVWAICNGGDAILLSAGGCPLACRVLSIERTGRMPASRISAWRASFASPRLLFPCGFAILTIVVTLCDLFVCCLLAIYACQP